MNQSSQRATQPLNGRPADYKEDRPQRPPATSRWFIGPFLWFNWGFAWIAYVLSKVALLKVLEYAGKATVLVAVVFWLLGAHQREEADRRTAWSVVNSKGGGRRDALEYLYHEGGFFADIDLHDADIEWAHLAESNLAGGNLRHSDLRWAQFKGANLEGANLNRADLRAAELINANLRAADLRDADLRAADLNGAFLQSADLTNAQLYLTDLTDAFLHFAHLTGAYLYSANLTGADLFGADLTGANLQLANLSSARLGSTDLSMVDLSGARLKDANLSRADLTSRQADHCGPDRRGSVRNESVGGGPEWR